MNKSLIETPAFLWAHEIYLNGHKVKLMEAAQNRYIMLSYYILNNELRYKPLPIGEPSLVGKFNTGIVSMLRALDVPLAVYSE